MPALAQRAASSHVLPILVFPLQSHRSCPAPSREPAARTPHERGTEGPRVSKGHSLGGWGCVDGAGRTPHLAPGALGVPLQSPSHPHAASPRRCVAGEIRGGSRPACSLLCPAERVMLDAEPSRQEPISRGENFPPPGTDTRHQAGLPPAQEWLLPSLLSAQAARGGNTAGWAATASVSLALARYLIPPTHQSSLSSFPRLGSGACPLAQRPPPARLPGSRRVLREGYL